MPTRRRKRPAPPRGAPPRRHVPYPSLSEEAVELLRLLAFFAPDDILLDMVILGRPLLPQRLAETVAEENRLQDALGYLDLHGLAELGIDTVSVPADVQAAARADLSEFDAAEWAAVAVRVVREAVPPFAAPGEGPSEGWSDLCPHALAAAAHARDLGVCSAEAAFVFAAAGSALAAAERFYRARPPLRAAVALYDRLPHPDSAELARTLTDLGCVCRALGRHAEAGRCFGRAMRLASAEPPSPAPPTGPAPARQPLAQHAGAP